MSIIQQNLAEPCPETPSTAAPPKASWPRWWLGGVVVLAVAGFSVLRLVAPVVLFGLTFLGLVPLASWQLYHCRVRRRWKVLVVVSVPLAVALAIGLRTHFRYQTAQVMAVPLREYANEEYPEDPADRSVHYGKYHGRQLVLVQKDDTHFDFVFEPRYPHIAKVAFRNVDVSLMTPSLPDWTKEDSGLRRIALTDRQWNRQQVRFEPHAPAIEVTDGDGFEKDHLVSAELAKNCLNAGLWEVLLFVKEGNGKALYYQGWFTFPLGHYKNIFEHNTGLSYWEHWYYLEHWFDPAGTHVSLEKLRRVRAERDAATVFDRSEKVIAAGEQVRKRRTTLAENVVSWGDVYDGRKVHFASFIPPGRYSVSHPWKNQYGRMDRFDKAILREVVSPASAKPLHELELIFRSSQQDGVCRFLVSGFDLNALPQLPTSDYPKGLYMPMGIGVPPFFQSYQELQQQPPYQSPYVSVLLDADDRWIDHHSFGIDGPVMHRDEKDPDVLHVYLLSYERHSLIAHVVVSTGVP